VRFRAALGLSCTLLVVAACKKHIPVTSVEEIPYPACTSEAGALVPFASGHLRAGETAREKDVVERFHVDRDACGQYLFEGREEWHLMGADIEVVYDDKMMPLRAWKRMTIPGVTRPDGDADIRRYELRSRQPSIKRRDKDGHISYELLKIGGKTAPPEGTRIAAVIGPGRGVLTMWLKQAHLAVGQKRRDLVLDFREMVETLSDVTLTREPDQFEASIGKNVRVYTIYGREPVFADDNDVVIGDLAGLRPSASVSAPEPPPIPTYGPPDPIGTP
jgi:hypothetical protein